MNIKDKLIIYAIILIIMTFLILGIFRLLTGKKGSYSEGLFRLNKDISKVTGFTTSKNQPAKYSKGELECRRVLEVLFEKNFDSIRPDFLRNPVTGNRLNLELDCFNPELKLAVEYNGQQHYKFLPYFHKNKEAFYNQKYRDELKRKMCKEANITLIEVPYTVKLPDIKYYLYTQLKNLKFV